MAIRRNIYLLFFVLLSCCDDGDAIPQPPPPPACLEVVCETEEEFYGKAIMNGECWKADITNLDVSPGGTFSINLNKYEVNGIGEGLSIVLYKNANLEDTLWIGFTNSGNPSHEVAPSYYGYQNFHGLEGEFSFPFGTELTYKDYLLIDYFNADTSIVEGRFQVRFPSGSVNSYINAPDTMRRGCGSFRVKKD
jgi:hypothetical protein